MTSCIDYCDKPCQHRRLMATMLYRSFLCHYIFELAACKALGTGSMQRQFSPQQPSANPCLDQAQPAFTPRDAWRR